MVFHNLELLERNALIFFAYRKTIQKIRFLWWYIYRLNVFKFTLLRVFIVYGENTRDLLTWYSYKIIIKRVNQT